MEILNQIKMGRQCLDESSSTNNPANDTKISQQQQPSVSLEDKDKAMEDDDQKEQTDDTMKGTDDIDENVDVVGVLGPDSELYNSLRDTQRTYESIQDSIPIVGEFSFEDAKGTPVGVFSAPDGKFDEDDEFDYDEDYEFDYDEDEDFYSSEDNEDQFGRTRGTLFPGMSAAQVNLNNGSSNSVEKSVRFSNWEQAPAASSKSRPSPSVPTKSSLKNTRSFSSQNEESLQDSSRAVEEKEENINAPSNIMKSEVVERPLKQSASKNVPMGNAEYVDKNEDNDNEDFSVNPKDVAREFYRLREKMIQTHGGYGVRATEQENEEEQEKGNSVMEEGDRPKKKVSLFKAARLGR